MIALAATDIDSDNTHMETNEEKQLDVSATLIVVPPPRKLGFITHNLHVAASF